ncbi:hypothetical protein, variant [Aphanomyces invadans]|uniref:Uncharacterized protein n=1 Tax=Aphanomyces invadans TaxID=157072 RepID=A0A024U1F7_9STRA|nr:hypothetical protein, variant [Aphanomyces invadans]ETW00089.1 hypothetical protein, variant [Aphanomyces invadans]|eukprot:XP_008871114.1 hypothetical protein, variant [Aphanomyces invadans]
MQSRRWLSTIRRARRRLAQRGVAASDINVLVAHAHDPPLSRESLFLHPDKLLTPAESQRLEDLTSRRLAGEPLAYVTGVKEFWSLPFKVTKDTLIPRPDSELLIDTLLNLHTKDDPLRILDIGTGTGCLIVAALAEFPNATGVAIDISPAALQVARHNADTHGMASRMICIEQDMRRFDRDMTLHWATPPFDVVLCNPPYISMDEVPWMDAHVVLHEPHLALFADHDGLALYSVLRSPLRDQLLRPGGHVLFEVGFAQAARVVDLYKGASFIQSTRLDRMVVQDVQGIDRVVVMQTRP